jgi:cell division control protein 24
MADPLSVAASVAGLISLGAATSKLVYQFVSSVIDAPKEVRAIISSLYSVNIALCQIQTLLLDQVFAAQTANEDLVDLERSVTSCVASFSIVEKELKGVSHAGSEQLTAKKLWHQVKQVFEKEAMQNALLHLETEKGTLQLIMTTLNR